MRELKFRVWNENVGGFSELIIPQKFKDRGIDSSPKCLCWITGELDGVHEWQQFTGMKDRIGNEIYEGDILSYKDKDNLTEESFVEPVFWDGEIAEYHTESSNHVFPQVAKLSKVVGNIYQNPELI